ncbi:MAG: aminotransferase class III-fold pyridoxal phosphate-dependent enzyme [Microthrixaceae bacterium]|nr:aminotransferase class III-fold pyridoxal phosphate-dependent enzyme [Microthrixaceae bacterium]
MHIQGDDTAGEVRRAPIDALRRGAPSPDRCLRRGAPEPRSMPQARCPEPVSTPLRASSSMRIWCGIPMPPCPPPLPAVPVTGASGTRLHLGDGREVVDGMSSWWAAIHGYGHPVLDEAVRAQLDSMAHVMFGGLTHAPAVELAQLLVEISPEGLEHVFFADSGSVSVEVAIKMALQHARGTGRPERTRLLTVRSGYHGDTLGAMSVCDPVNGMHSMFSGVLPASSSPPPRSPASTRRSRQRTSPASNSCWPTTPPRSPR